MIDLSSMAQVATLSRLNIFAEAAKRIGVLCIGDSNIPAHGNTAGLTYRVDPAWGSANNRPTTFVKAFRRIANTVPDPLVFDVVADNVAVGPYTGLSAVVYSGMTTWLCDMFTKYEVPAVLSEFAEVGLELTQMVSGSYPSSGGAWYSQMLAFQRNVEATQNVKTRIIFVSAGNNDGLNATKSNNIPANMTTLYNNLVADFPGAVICWLKINLDTNNFAGFNPGGVDTIANQAAGFLALPNIIQVWADDAIASVGVEIDHAHLTVNGLRLAATRAFWLAWDRLGFARPRTSTSPVLVGDGAVAATDGTGAPTDDGASFDQDLQVLVVEDMTVGATFAAQPTPVGWNFHSSQVENTGAGVGCRMLVYYRTVTSAMRSSNHGNSAATSVALTAPSTRLFGKIYTIRGTNPAAAPSIAQAVYAGVTGNSTSYTGPSITTGGSNRRLLVITTGFISANAATTATLTGLTGGSVYRNSVVVTPGTAGVLMDAQETLVATPSTISITNVATSRTITGPKTVALEIMN